MLTASIALAVYCLTTQQPAAQSGDGATTPPQHNATEPAAPGEGVIQMLKNGGVGFELIDSQGARHKASLVHIDGDDVVLRSRNELFTVPVNELQRADRRGDRPWDGALIGLGVGLGFWALVAQQDAGGGLDWKEDNPDDFTLRDTISLLCFSTTVGYLVDAFHVGKHTVLVGPMHSAPRPRALTLAISGAPHERTVKVGYRVAF